MTNTAVTPYFLKKNNLTSTKHDPDGTIIQNIPGVKRRLLNQTLFYLLVLNVFFTQPMLRSHLATCFLWGFQGHDICLVAIEMDLLTSELSHFLYFSNRRCWLKNEAWKHIFTLKTWESQRDELSGLVNLYSSWFGFKSLSSATETWLTYVVVNRSTNRCDPLCLSVIICKYKLMLAETGFPWGEVSSWPKTEFTSVKALVSISSWLNFSPVTCFFPHSHILNSPTSRTDSSTELSPVNVWLYL